MNALMAILRDSGFDPMDPAQVQAQPLTSEEEVIALRRALCSGREPTELQRDEQKKNLLILITICERL